MTSAEPFGGHHHAAARAREDGACTLLAVYIADMANDPPEPATNGPPKAACRS